MDDVKESVLVKTESGVIIRMDLPLHEAIADRVKKGYMSIVAEDGTPDAAGSADAVRPAVSASKADWVGFAVAESARRGTPISPDDAEALTKQDLIERYGTTVPEAADPATVDGATVGEDGVPVITEVPEATPVPADGTTVPEATQGH